MKRLVTAVMLLGLSICCGIFVFFKTTSEASALLNAMTNERSYVISTQSVEERRAEELFEQWKTSEKTLAVFLQHTKISDVDLCAYNLIDYAKQRNTDEYLETLNECIASLERVIDTEKISMSNIF